MTLDIRSARASRPYTHREYCGRALWALATPLFRFSPRVLFGWRRFLLRCFGAQVGQAVHIDPTAHIEIPWNLDIGVGAAIGAHAWIYSLGPIQIGARTTVSHRAHLCAGTHDYTDPALPLQRIGLTIGADAWVCSDALIGPGVTVGDGAVVGAGAVAMRDVESWTVVAGNPACFVKHRQMQQASPR